MTGEPKYASDQTPGDAVSSDPDLWLRYFELGGMSTPAEVDSYLRGGVVQTAHDREVLAQALTERPAEFGRNRLALVREDPPTPPTSGTRPTRDQAADERDKAADERDKAADERDKAAVERDQAAEQSETEVSGGITTDALDRSALARREAASDRRQASQDRGSGASERAQAQLDRNTALADREVSARVQAPVGRAMSSSLSPSFADAEVQLGLLGSFSLRINTEPLRLPMNAQRLVCFLALHDGLMLRQHVAGSLWGDSTERRAGGSLRSALWRLGHPTHPLIEVGESHVRLSPSVAVDVHASEALARRVLDDSQDLSEADLDGALLSADLLPGWTEDWVLVRREHHTQLRLRTLDVLCRRLSEMGRFGRAVQVGMLAVSGEPLRESAQRTLIGAHLAQGNNAAAAKQYDAFRELLRVELNLEPSQEMQNLVKGLSR